MDRRHNSNPIINTLCWVYGGVSNVPLVVAFKELDTANWEALIARLGNSIADRMTDRTAMILAGRLTDAGRDILWAPEIEGDINV